MSALEEIPINDKLRNLGVTKFVKQGNLVQIIISRHKVVSFSIHPKEFQRTMERFRESALNSTAGLSKEIVSKMEHILVHPSNRYTQYLLSGNSKEENELKSKKLNQTYATVYADRTSLYEAVIIGGVPFFAQVSSSTHMISLCTEIQLDEDNIILPLPVNVYASRPYGFDSEKEFRKIEHQVKSRENLDTLFQKVEAQWNLYVDNGKEHNIMCAGDTIFTYYQDILGTTHYDFFVGDNGTGKTNNLHLFNLLAYRNVLSSEMTAPNIYQLLGNDKDGVVTICEDEADGIDDDRAKMKIYKDGATTNVNVFRTDISFGRKQLRYKTFCFKAFAAEELPDAKKAKGFRQRCLIFKCTYGSPRYDIAEVIEPGGDKKLQALLNDLFKLRNMLLVHRLLHYQDELPNVELNIKDREKQLFKPIFRVFQKSHKALKKLKLGINKYLSDYRKRRSSTFHAALYKVVTDLINRERTTELKFTLIWTSLKDDLQGKNVPNKSMLFECADFGTIYQGDVSTTLQEVFGAEKKRRTKGERFLKFNRMNLNKLSRVYEVPTEINVITIATNNSTNNNKIAKNAKIESKNKQNKRVTGETGETTSGNKHLKTKLKKFIGISKNTSSKSDIKKKSAYARRPSHLSQSSPNKNYKKYVKKGDVNI